MKRQFDWNKNLLAAVERSLDAKFVSKLDQERAERFAEAVKITADMAGGTPNLGAALRMVLLTDQELFEEVAYLEEQKGVKTMRYAYDRLAKSVDGQTGFERAAAIDAEAGNADGDFATLFVEQTIKKRVEMDSELLSMLDNKRLTAKSGKFPKSSNLAKCAFAAVSDDLTDLTDTIDDGFDKTEVEAEKFGGTMFLEAEVFVKLDAQVVSQILDELTIAYRRGMIDQVINGDGTGVNALGLAPNATAVTFDGNVTNTLIKMIAAVADTSRGGMKDIFILTNTAGAITLHGEKFINASYNDLIEALGGSKFLASIPVIEENVIVTSGSSPDKTAPLYVGKKGDYLRAVQTDPQIEIDKFSDFKAGGETARIMGFWDGKPHFNDSFAKTTIPAIY
jgi:HK97 family phage major capsid protein